MSDYCKSCLSVNSHSLNSDKMPTEMGSLADQCGADSAHLLIFDRDPGAHWDDKIYLETHTQDKWSISVWGM